VAPASLSLITARYGEGPARTRALGLYGATASIGFVAGQVLGGVLVQYTSWRSIFLVNVPVGLTAAWLAPRLISPDRTRARIRHLDVPGGLLATVAVAAMVFAVSEGASLGWGHPLVLTALVVAAGAGIGFVLTERVHPFPLVDIALLRRQNLRTAGLLTFFVGAWTAGELVVLSLYLQQTLHDSALFAGLVIAPQGVVGFVTGMFGARLVRRLGMRMLLVVSTAASGAGFLVLMHLPATGRYSPLFAAVVLVGFGTVGTVFGTTVMAASGMADADQGLVGGVVNTTRQVGAAVGVALLAAIAERGAAAAAGVTTVSGDRSALMAAAAIALAGSVVAWFGAGSKPTTAATVVRSATPLPIELATHITTNLRRTA
jgi:MFS family permease